MVGYGFTTVTSICKHICGSFRWNGFRNGKTKPISMDEIFRWRLHTHREAVQIWLDHAKWIRWSEEENNNQIIIKTFLDILIIRTENSFKTCQANLYRTIHFQFLPSMHHEMDCSIYTTLATYHKLRPTCMLTRNGQHQAYLSEQKKKQTILQK